MVKECTGWDQTTASAARLELARRVWELSVNAVTFVYSVVQV
jgi:hypothetical protein